MKFNSSLCVLSAVTVSCGCQAWWCACVERQGSGSEGGVDGVACSGGWSWWFVLEQLDGDEEVLLLDWQCLAASVDYPQDVVDAGGEDYGPTGAEVDVAFAWFVEPNIGSSKWLISSLDVDFGVRARLRQKFCLKNNLMQLIL
ncbi:unnamed protein product [Dovyalis caffra]|uniref:Secreted protein n=1 Tax=Dovyalis caffra TaxID=77055 RepID=A0AAV1SQW8_9ROSI|nr:unnamed protein product [Dovyalis caffra]